MTATTITLNGRTVQAEIAPRTSLADFVREHVGLTGTHLGCEHGVCGACTVEIDGEIARSCIAFAVACDGASVRTIEGFENDLLMERLRKAFTEEHALQCGYCTPGMLIAARDLVRRGEARTHSEIKAAMSGNLCRCTGYAGIIAAVKRVLDEELASEVGQGEDSRKAAPLGPVGTYAPILKHAEALAPAAPAPAKRASMALAPVTSPRRETIRVSTGAHQEREGTTTLSQSFALPHPIEAVWGRMRDLEQLVQCLPGASLDGLPAPDGHFSGTMNVVFGPISAAFKGSGHFNREDPDYTVRIDGMGQDARAGAKAQGVMSFRLIGSGDTETLVEATISYRLAGALAQFGRPSLVRGIVTEIGSVFATNMDRAIAGETPAGDVPKGLGAEILLGAIVRTWASALRRRLSILRYLLRSRK